MWFNDLLQDLKFALRSLAKAPTFVIVTLATLGLGVGANTATFGVLKSIALNPLPYRDPERLVLIAECDGRTTNPQDVAFPTAEDFRQSARSFESLSVFKDFDITAIEQGRADFLRGMAVNSNFFDVLGIKMLLGRSFLQEEDRPNANNKLILSYGLWKSRYGADPNIIGRVVPAAHSSYTIVGVLPRDFHPLHMTNPGEVPVLFAPLGFDLSEHSCRACRGPRLLGRLKIGVTPGQSQAELNSIMRQLARTYPADYASDASAAVTPFREQLVGNFDSSLWIVFGAVALLLLLACANVANLVLVRSVARSSELALRNALGASRSRIVRQLLTESLLMAIAGGAVGTACAYSITLMLAHTGAQEIPRVDEIAPGASMLIWGLGVSLFTGLLFGLLPAWQATRTDPQSFLRRGRSPLGMLIISEVALAFVLALGVGLLAKSYWRLIDVDLGYDPRNVLTMSLVPDWWQYDTVEKRLRYFEDVANRERNLPGVLSVAYASTFPLSHPASRRFYVREQTLLRSEAPHVDAYYISSDYFLAMKTPLLRGRLLGERDRRGLAPVAVIGESCARTLFKGQDPIGQHIQMDARNERAPWATVVGIVADVHQYGLDKAPGAAVYLPLAQARDPQGWGSLIVRCAVDPKLMEPAITNAMRAVDPRQPVFHVQPMEAYIAKSLAQRTFVLALIGVFGGLALLLAAAGIYGVISYAVAMRTREMGIRIAVGAESGDVICMILRQVFNTASVGLAIGLGLSLLCSRLLSRVLYGVQPNDVTTIASVVVLIFAVVLAASYVPARRAARLDPMKALRSE